MILSEISIRRPVLATVVNLIIVLIGLMAWDRLTIRQYPNIDDPVVTIATTYPGANAEIMESQVTTPLEDSISGIEGIDYVSSISRAESSQISVRFTVARDPEGAANDVRDRVARARAMLPREVEDPIVARVESDARPIIYLAMSSARHSQLEITDYADRYVKDRLQILPGVAQLLLMGERRYAMRIWLDRDLLAAYALTPADIERALRAQNVEVPSGRIESSGREFTVLSETDLTTPEEFRKIILKDADGYLVRLGDVATIGDRDVLNVILREDQQYQRSVRYEFRGPRKLGDRIRDVVIGATDLPDGYRIEGQQEWSWSDDEQKQIYTVLALSLVLVFMVTSALFESLRQPISVLLTVPMALIGVFLMFFFTEASFTREAYIGVIMMGGIVVNNAILLVDHVNQLRRRDGIPLMDAVVRGTLERVRPILMTSATTIFGLLPLVVLSETVNANIWNALGYALIGGLASSTLFVLTVTPALYVLFERGPEARRVARAEIAAGAPAPVPVPV